MLFLTPSDLDDLITRIHTHAVPLSFRNPAAVLQGKLYASRCGLGLPVADVSLLTHSCIPNCFVAYDHRTASVVVRASQTILEGEPLCVSLVEDLYQPTARRKNLFASLKVIDCVCGRCRDPSEGGRFVDGLRCEDCLFGFVCPRRHARVQALMERRKCIDPSNRQWECTDCGLVPTDAYEQKIVKWKERLRKAEAERESGGEMKFRVTLLSLFDEMLKQAHPFNHLFFSVCLNLTSSFQRNPQKSPAKALRYQRLAEVAVRAVLPAVCPELMELSALRCQLSFASTQQIAFEPAWRSLWCAYCCFGNKSAEWLFALQRLRLMFAAGGEFEQTYSNGKIVASKVTDSERLVAAAVELWPSGGRPSADAAAEKDPHVFFFAACRAGNAAVLRSFLGTDKHGAWPTAIDPLTGVPGVAVVAMNTNTEPAGPAFKLLLDFTPLPYLLYRNEWGLTLVMSLCARRTPHLDKLQSDMITRVLMAVKSKAGAKQLRTFIAAEASVYAGKLQAIHYAAARNKPRCITTLLAYGANPLATTVELATPLHLAAITGSAAAVECLLTTMSHTVDACTHRGETALMSAAYGLHAQIVRALIARGSNVFHVSDCQGTTVLHALVAGVTRTFRVTFAGSLHKADPFLHAAAGFNAATVHRLYEPSDTAQPTYASVPVIENESPELLLVPETLSKRLDTAIQIVEAIRSHINAATGISGPTGIGGTIGPSDENNDPSYTLDEPSAQITTTGRIGEDLFAHCSKDGFTASELLMHQWDSLEETRRSLLLGGRTDIRFDCVDLQTRQKMMEAWLNDVSVKILHLAQILKPCVETEPVSLQLRQMAALGNRVALDETPLDVATTGDSVLIDATLHQLLEGKPREWDAKQTKIVTKADKEEAEKAKIKEQALKEVVRARDEELKKELPPPIQVKPAKLSG